MIVWKALPSFLVQLRLDPSMLTSFRSFAFSFSKHATGEDKCAHRLAIVLHEMLENVAKYGTDREAAVDFKFTSLGPRPSFQLRVSNRTVQLHHDRLQRFFADAKQYASADEHYMALMRVAAKSKEDCILGLARIRAEASMHLALTSDGDSVELYAETLEETE